MPNPWIYKYYEFLGRTGAHTGGCPAPRAAPGYVRREAPGAALGAAE